MKTKDKRIVAAKRPKPKVKKGGGAYASTNTTRYSRPYSRLKLEHDVLIGIDLFGPEMTYDQYRSISKTYGLSSADKLKDYAGSFRATVNAVATKAGVIR